MYLPAKLNTEPGGIESHFSHEHSGGDVRGGRSRNENDTYQSDGYLRRGSSFKGCPRLVSNVHNISMTSAGERPKRKSSLISRIGRSICWKNRLYPEHK
jgi:hypothetical protein